MKGNQCMQEMALLYPDNKISNQQLMRIIVLSRKTQSTMEGEQLSNTTIVL